MNANLIISLNDSCIFRTTASVEQPISGIIQESVARLGEGEISPELKSLIESGAYRNGVTFCARLASHDFSRSVALDWNSPLSAQREAIEIIEAADGEDLSVTVSVEAKVG